MGITVLKNNVPWGPFSRAQIEQGLGRGDFTLQYLAHAPGLKEWLPLGEVIHFVDAKASLPPVPAQSELPSTPGPGTLTSARPPILPNLPHVVSVASEKFPTTVPPTLPVEKKPEVQLTPAPFIPRAIAFGIDCTVIFGPILLIVGLSALATTVQGWWQSADSESMRQEWALWHRNFHELLLLAAIGLGWLYAAGLECSTWQATLGKRWVGIKVTDMQGERLGFLRATGRHFAKYLSALPCFLGFMAALFSSRSLALHDRLAGTRVVQR